MKLIAAIAMLSFALSLCGLTEKFTSKKDESGNSNNSNSSTSNSNKGTDKPSDSSGGGDVATPEMTASQKAAIEGGQTVTWAEQGITWTVPANWKKMSSDVNSLQWQSPSPYGFLIVNVSSMSADFPVGPATDALFTGDAPRKQSGELLSYRWLSLDGVKGVEDLEAEKSAKGDPRRLQWRGYRNYKGMVQYVSIMLSSESQNFSKHDDALHAILYSTKIDKE